MGAQPFFKTQTIAYEFETDSFDGVSVAPATNTVRNDQQQFYVLPGGRQPALGVFPPNDPSEEDVVGAYGNRWISWIEIVFDAAAPAGTTLDVVDADNGVVLRNLEDLAGRTSFYTDLGVFVPQGGALRVNGGAGRIRYHVIFLSQEAAAKAAIAVNNQLCCEGDPTQAPVGESLVFAAVIVEDSGIVNLQVGEVQQYDASGLAAGAMDFEMPANPVKGQFVAIKEVGNSTVSIDIDGNGNLVEVFDAAPAATQVLAEARVALIWQFDGVDTWRAVWAFRPGGAGPVTLPIDPDNPSGLTTDIAEDAALLYANATSEYVSRTYPNRNPSGGSVGVGVPLIYHDSQKLPSAPDPDMTAISEMQTMVRAPVDPTQTSVLLAWSGRSNYPWIELNGTQGGPATYDNQGALFSPVPSDVMTLWGPGGENSGGTAIWISKARGAGGGSAGSATNAGRILTAWTGVANDAAWAIRQINPAPAAAFTRLRFTVSWDSAGVYSASWTENTNYAPDDAWVFYALRYETTGPVLSLWSANMSAGDSLANRVTTNGTPGVGSYVTTVSGTPELGWGNNVPAGQKRTYDGFLAAYWLFTSYLTDDQVRLMFNLHRQRYLGL